MEMMMQMIFRNMENENEADNCFEFAVHVDFTI